VFGVDDDNLQIVVVDDFGDDVVGAQHVLIEQVAEREIFRIVVDRHHGDDLLRVQIKRQRALDRHADLDLSAGLIDAGHGFGQPLVRRIRHHFPQLAWLGNRNGLVHDLLDDTYSITMRGAGRPAAPMPAKTLRAISI
jgi:hypothetical protein